MADISEWQAAIETAIEISVAHAPANIQRETRAAIARARLRRTYSVVEGAAPAPVLPAEAVEESDTQAPLTP